MSDNGKTPQEEFEQQLRDAIGATLRRVRAELRLTQEDVAEMLRITPEYYARLERGHAMPSITMFDKIVATLDVSADEFLGQAASGQPGPDTESAKGKAPRRPVPPVEPPEDSREVRSLMRRLSNAPLSRIRFLNRFVKGLENYLK